VSARTGFNVLHHQITAMNDVVVTVAVICSDSSRVLMYLYTEVPCTRSN